MLEQEIKLHLPSAARAKVLKQLGAQPGPRRVRLRAMYFDTPDRQLGQQWAALRLRLEGRRWVQTFKMAGKDSMSRLELNHPRPDAALDLSVYADTPAAAVIEGLKGKLVLRYETDVLRLKREVRVRAGVVEVACDVGQLRAGELLLPINEVEFELLHGRPVALFTLAHRWQKECDLALDLRSKAERGDALAQAWLRSEDTADERRTVALARYVAPHRQSAVVLSAQESADKALRRVSSECLDQINRNGLLVTGVDGLKLTANQEAEAVHQWRIGVRRLRSAWKWFDGVTALPPEPWRDEAREFFSELGANRDVHVLQEVLLPPMVESGMPPIALEVDVASESQAVVLLSSARYQNWLLHLYEWTMQDPTLRAAKSAPAPAAKAWPENRAENQSAESVGDAEWVEQLVRRLRKWHRQLVRDGRRFHRLTDDERHDLRKLGKRLRYNLAFAEALLPAKRLRPYKAQLAVVQDVLGEINDRVTARDALSSRLEEEPQAWFGIGWLAASLDGRYEQAAREFRKLEALKPFWGKRLG